MHYLILTMSLQTEGDKGKKHRPSDALKVVDVASKASWQGCVPSILDDPSF
jgi:hypothetical protein